MTDLSKEIEIVHATYESLYADHFKSFCDGLLVEQNKIGNPEPGAAEAAFRKGNVFLRECRDRAIAILKEGA